MALAINFAVQGLPAREAFVVHQYGLAATILGAALRLMKISHIDTQRSSTSSLGARKPPTKCRRVPVYRTWRVSRR